MSSPATAGPWRASLDVRAAGVDQFSPLWLWTMNGIIRTVGGRGVLAMLKLSDNPPVLGLLARSVREFPGRWWVGHTRARSEKALAWDLVHREIGYFLPMVERTRFSGGRKRRVVLPLFPSYVFICGDDDARQAAMMTNRLCQMIEVADQAALVTELSAIEKAVAGKAELDLHPFAALGQRCRITAGAFRGVAGVVVRRRGQVRLVLQVSLLGQGVSMETDADLLEPVD